MWTWRRRCATPPHSGGRRPPRVVPVLGGKGSTSTGNSSRSLMYDRERRPTSTLWITCSFYFCLCFQDASFWQIVDRARQIYLFPGCLFLADCTVHGRSTVVHPVIRTCVFLSPPTCRTRRADAGRAASPPSRWVVSRQMLRCYHRTARGACHTHPAYGNGRSLQQRCSWRQPAVLVFAHQHRRHHSRGKAEPRRAFFSVSSTHPYHYNSVQGLESELFYSGPNS